jgi:hypothetical protein
MNSLLFWVLPGYVGAFIYCFIVYDVFGEAADASSAFSYAFDNLFDVFPGFEVMVLSILLLAFVFTFVVDSVNSHSFRRSWTGDYYVFCSYWGEAAFDFLVGRVPL